eukprot:752302-Hanusia_phi.AAC.3
MSDKAENVETVRQKLSELTVGALTADEVEYYSTYLDGKDPTRYGREVQYIDDVCSKWHCPPKDDFGRKYVERYVKAGLDYQIPRAKHYRENMGGGMWGSMYFHHFPDHPEVCAFVIKQLASKQINQ